MRSLLRVRRLSPNLVKRHSGRLFSLAGSSGKEHDSHTIYALATPKGRAGVAVIRVSGEAVPDVCSRMVRFKGAPLRHSVMKRCEVVDSKRGYMIDDGMCVLFEGLVLTSGTLTPPTLPPSSEIIHNRTCARATYPLKPSNCLSDTGITLLYTVVPASSTRRVHATRFCRRAH